MMLHAATFLAGTLLLHEQRELPSITLLCLLSVPAVACWRVRPLRPLLSLLVGFILAAVDAQARLELRLPASFYQRELSVNGQIVGLPERSDRRLMFRFRIDEAARQPDFPTPMLVRLSWYETQALPAGGERWQLRVRLKPPRGFLNPAAFDYEGWLFRERIGAVGYVLTDTANRRIAPPSAGSTIHALRQELGSAITRELGSDRAAATLRALTIGDRAGFTPADWALFRGSGTNHLVAVSGLHIGIAGGLSFWLCGALWRRLPGSCLRIPAPQAAALGAMAGATGYAALAGFSIPTQRALVMLTVVMGGLLVRTGIRSTHTLSVALVAILLLDPTASLSAGFWLSFAAVAVILAAVANRAGRRSRLRALVRIQCLITLGLAPVLLLWELPVPAVAPLVNLFAVPFYSLLLIPLALLSAAVSLCAPAAGAPLLQLTAWLIEMSLRLMEVAADTSWELTPPPLSSTGLWLSLSLGLLLLLLPRGIPGRWLGVLLLLPLLLVPGGAPSLPKGAVALTMLDVGQGMALVVQTATHTLVYDSGPRYSSRFDAGSGIVAPFLRSAGIARVDRVLLSNGDSDHSGGVAGLMNRLHIDSLLSGEPRRATGYAAEPCRAGRRWHWDGVDFELLHPGAGQQHWTGNDASCVLLVSGPGGRILITGDIESRAERRLLQCCRDRLAADIVTVPHHGSATSSTQPLVAAVDPDYALVSSGYLNRYDFPRPAVRERWLNVGAELLNTAGSGAIRFYLSPTTGLKRPERYRVTGRRYWNYPAH